MSITIDLPPAVMQEATSFAESRKTTFAQFLLESIENEIKRQRQATEWLAKLDALVKGGASRLPGKEPYKFDRADAYPEGEFA